MSPSVEAVEAALSQLHANIESVDPAPLALVANYPDYLVLLTDQGMPTAPDTRGRKLGAIFTTEAALEAFRAKVQPGQAHPTTVAGPELFHRFRDLKLEGVVFNCCGPQHPIAFTPDLLDHICKHLGIGPDFDTLAAAAFPGGQLGPTAALDALWGALFSLDVWHFPAPTGGSSPYLAIYEDQRCVFAFTDQNRLAEFGATDGVCIPLPEALDWIEQAGANGDFDVVQFNLGGLGWFCPVENFGAIRRRLNK